MSRKLCRKFCHAIFPRFWGVSQPFPVMKKIPGKETIFHIWSEGRLRGLITRNEAGRSIQRRKDASLAISKVSLNREELFFGVKRCRVWKGVMLRAATTQQFEMLRRMQSWHAFGSNPSIRPFLRKKVNYSVGNSLRLGQMYLRTCFDNHFRFFSIHHRLSTHLGCINTHKR